MSNRARQLGIETEQLVDVLAREALCATSILRQYARNKISLLLLQLQDLLFDRSRCNAAVKLRPDPPALRLIKNTVTVGSS